ncbi:MAG: FRG domain-containing protein, partial [Spirochaetales bacterium]|nr:FRG domain-containing protein [Spirochaetales bacterium]
MIADVKNTQSLEKYIKNLKNYLDDKWGDDVDVIYINNVDFGQKSEFELKYSFVADVIVVDKVHKEVIELYKYNLPSMIRYGKGENHIVCKDTDIIKTEIIGLYRNSTDIPKTAALYYVTLIGKNGVQLELITKQDIDSLSSFVFAVKSIQNGSLCRSFYRGQKKSSYDLSPSVCRKDPDNKYFINKNYIKKEKKMINEAIINRPFDFSNSMTMFDILVKMQHYSFPTRLLDITLNYL